MRKRKIDISLAIAFFILVFFGIVMISSVSVYESYQLTEAMTRQGYLNEPTNSFYLWRHMGRVLMALPFFFMMLYLPVNWWKRAALFLFAIALFMLIALFLPGVGANYGTSTSWIDLPFLPSLQPAEFVKLALVFYLAVWMEKRQELVHSFQYGFLPFTILLSMVVVLLAMQPDFGSVLVISVIAASMFFAAGGSILHILSGALLAAGMAYPIIMSKDYIRNRFMAFLNPDTDILNTGFQIKQALIAVGSGGVFGVGFGKSIQKFGYLPEVQGDTIFAAAAEELGFIRITLLVVLYLWVAYRGYSIANRTSNRFYMLVAVGITSWFTFQAIINIGVNLALLPLTGLTLPFVSYGGSSLIANMMAAGLLLNISRYAEEVAPSTLRGRNGGHVMPNLAVASVLKYRHPKAEMLYIGSRSQMDRELVAPSNIRFKGIFTGKLRRYFSWRHFVDPFLFLIGFIQSFFILLFFWPKVVFSKGGYVSLPVVLAAFILRRPVILHESDGVMGLANRIAARFATKVCVSFPDVLPDSEKAVLTGNPIRTNILGGDRHAGYRLTNFLPNKPVLLVWGGSQGAEQINRLIESQLEELTSQFQVIHITGKGKLGAMSDELRASNSYIAFEYVGGELKDLYAITDLVVGRGGANSLFELAQMRKPNIIIPLSNADQQANALYFEQNGGSIVYRENDDLAALLKALWQNEVQREGMVSSLKAISKPNATDQIVDVITQLFNEDRN